jgi:hypothetical protein
MVVRTYTDKCHQVSPFILVRIINVAHTGSQVVTDGLYHILRHGNLKIYVSGWRMLQHHNIQLVNMRCWYKRYLHTTVI